MDIKEELFPLVDTDALHEYSGRTLFVELVTDRDECLGASSDPSRFSPFGLENLLEEVGE